MDELEERRQLDLLIEEQARDDTHVVYPERGHEKDLRLDADVKLLDHRIDCRTVADGIGVDEDGEIVSIVRNPRGSVLVAGASFHGTLDGYNNHGCRCARCRRAIADYRAERRRAKAAAL